MDIRTIRTIRGFRSTNNNCFINCLMMAMFAYKYSPFFDKDKFKNKNSEIVYNYIVGLMEKIWDGESPDCNVLRRVLPRDLQWGQQDVTETYSHLATLLELSPTRVTYSKTFGTDGSNTSKTVTVSQKVPYIQIDNANKQMKLSDHFEGSWEDMGPKENWIKDDNNIPQYRYMKQSITRLKGDIVVMSINRTSWDRKYDNRVSLPDIIQIGDKKLHLMSVIIHISSGTIHSGHYIAVLKDDNNQQYVYDDHNDGPIGNYPLGESQREFVERNWVMCFYFTRSRTPQSHHRESPIEPPPHLRRYHRTPSHT